MAGALDSGFFFLEYCVSRDRREPLSLVNACFLQPVSENQQLVNAEVVMAMIRVSVLRGLSRQRKVAEALGLSSCTSAFSSGALRHFNIFSVFSKEARDKERARLKDEMNRGYFDDFRELKKTGGKVAIASQNLVPVLAAGKFPPLTTYTKTGDCVFLPITENGSAPIRASVVCMAFRASAQSMIESWTKPLLTSFQQSSASIEVVEVSVVDSWFLSIPPIKHAMLRSMREPAMADGEHPLKKKIVYAFGDTYFFRRELGIPNVLAGYLFLVDKKGRVRWRASVCVKAGNLSENSCSDHVWGSWAVKCLWKTVGSIL